MKVRAIVGVRLEWPRADGSVGFRDIAAGEILELPEALAMPGYFEPAADPPEAETQQATVA